MKSPIKLAFSLNAYTEHDPASAIADLARLGYEGVEILADSPHLFMHDWDERAICRVEEALRDSNISVSNINANTAVGYGFDTDGFEPSIIHPDPQRRKTRVEYTRNCIRLAKRLKAKCVAITSGKIADGQKTGDAWENLQSSLLPILDEARRNDVFIGLEYEPGLLLEDSVSLKKAFSKINHPHLGANLDLGHAEVVGENPAEILEELFPKVWNIHLEDIKDQIHNHLIPGLGDMDFHGIFKVLEKRDYRNFVTIEIYPYKRNPSEAAAQSLDFLLKTLKKP